MRVVFFTGAGISAASGVPTFADMGDIREKLTRSFANTHPVEYTETIRMMCEACNKAEPNPAHKAIAEAGFQVITMNVDKLHERAGSPPFSATNKRGLLEIHGMLPTQEQLDNPYFAAEYNGIVLYDDIAPKYITAKKLVQELTSNDFFAIVGTSFYTGISSDLLMTAFERKVNGVVINDNAETKVPRLCQILKEMESATDERKSVLMHEMRKMGETLGEAYVKVVRQMTGSFGCYGAWG
jgi:NAD-dependent deacetylase